MATDNQKKETAKALYLKGIESEKILELTGVCRQTLSRWINKEGWKELRSAYGMTRDELKQKLMAAASDAIDNPEDYHKNKKLADDLVKIMSAIEKLDKSTNVVHYVKPLSVSRTGCLSILQTILICRRTSCTSCMRLSTTMLHLY